MFVSCTNTDGSDKRNVNLVGKSADPWCLKNFNPSVCNNYRHNTKAWMTGVEFGDSIKNISEEVDIASCHKDTNLINVRLELLPPSCTGSLWLLVADINNHIKEHYRWHQVRKILDSINNGCDFVVLERCEETARYTVGLS
jgi:hypothetical protein